MDIFNQAKETIWSNTDLTEENTKEALNLLNQRNIDFGDLFFERVVSESFGLEEGIVKTASFNISKGVGVRAILGSKTGFAYSDVLDNHSLVEACKAARTISSGHNCNGVAINPTVVKAKPLYTSDDPIELMDREKKVAILKLLDELVRKQDSRIVQVMASLACAHRTIIVMPTDAPSCADIKPIVHISVSVVMEKDGRREIGSASAGGAIVLDELFKNNDLNELAKEAVRVASVNMEAINAPAGNMTVVLGAGWPGVLVHEAVGHGLEGDFNRTGSSNFTGKIGTQVASKACTIIDDGTIANRRGSMTFDDEGTKSGHNVLIENGILKGYMQDKQNALLMKTKVTGNGRRDCYNSLVLPRMTNTYLAAGDYDKEEIISSVKNGIYAVNFRGGQVDITSGQFVFSTSEAYLIENGKVTTPIKGATLIGNGPETMKKVSMVGNDLEFDAGIGNCGKAGQTVPVGIGQPTVKIDSITVGGTNA